MDDVVVFPGMSLTLAVDAGEDERVLLVPHHEQEFASVGTVAEISERDGIVYAVPHGLLVALQIGKGIFAWFGFQ